MHALIAQWREPEFWKSKGAAMHSMDYADALEAALAAALAPVVPEETCYGGNDIGRSVNMNEEEA